jgi:hypothetical protein
MRCLSLFFVIILLVGWGESQKINNELVLLDCKGVAHFLPNSDAAMIFDFSSFIDFYDYAHSVLFDRIKCKCPTITEDEFASRFAPSRLEFWLALIHPGGPVEISQCAQQFPEWDINFNLSKLLTNVSVDLKSCTYQNWKAGKDCMLKFVFSVFNIEIQVAIGHCTDNIFPYISVTCSGAACDSIGTPCNIDTDCSNPQKCWTLPTNVTTGSAFQSFVQGYLYDIIDTSPGCYPANTLISTLFDWIRTNIYQTSAGYKFPKLPTLDFRICYYEILNTTVPVNCSATTTATNTTVYSCTNLQDWDGKLADGTSVNSPTRIQGGLGTLSFDTVPTSTGVPFGYHSSDNSLTLFPKGVSGLISALLTTYPSLIDQLRAGNSSSALAITDYALSGAALVGSNIQIKFPILNKAADVWYPLNLQWQQCRAERRGRQLLENEYKIRYAWMLPYGLSLLTNPHQMFYNTQSDWYASFFKNSSIGTFVPPDSCTYSQYLKTTSCSMKFTGMQSLLNSDLTFNILIQDCPDWHFPAIYLECEGKDCDLFTQPQPCTLDSDCTQFPGTKCLSFANSANYDFIQAYFTHVWSASETCGSSNALLSDLQKFISHYTKTATTQNSVCFLDVKTLINTLQIQDWANSQYIVDGDKYWIKDLSAWTPPSTIDIPGTVAENNGISLVYSWLVFLLILITWCL